VETFPLPQKYGLNIRTGRSQEFATGDERGGLGYGVPQRGPGAGQSPGGDLGAKLPEAGDMLISSYNGGHAPPLPTPPYTNNLLLQK